MTKSLFFTQLRETLLSRSETGTANKLTDDYVQNYLGVCAYAAAVNKSQLPVLLEPPTHWQEYADALVGAKTDALVWVNTVMANLINLPDTIIAGQQEVLDVFTAAEKCCAYLIDDPTDENAKEKLKIKINESTDNLEEVTKSIKHVTDLLSKFKSTLPEQAAKLQKIADLALQDEKADKDKVAELKQDIEEMKREINSLSAAIAGLAIADVAAVLLSVLGFVIAGFAGFVVLIFTGAVIATASYYIAIDTLKIKELKKKIESDTTSMNDYTKDISILYNTSSLFHDLADKAAQMESNLQYILSVWQSLNGDLQKVATEIETAGANYTAQDWKSVNDDFVEATHLWNTFIEQVHVCKIDVKGNTCQLQPGMSAQEVEQASKAGTEMGILDYLNSAS
ncbi:MAG: hypothetical protein LBD89_02370 [Tannerellaceae bacterium]|jgi:methyl-accepting chemotaxis protein|nr:hypothetical protein [Tannerellaceae bacterium]